MKRLATAAALTALFAGQASALSCMAPDPVHAFSDAAAAEEVYVIVLGTFSDGPGARPGGTMNGEPRAYEAFFAGTTLDRNGPAEAVNRQVRVTETCAGPWCAELPTDRPVLTFLQIDPEGGAPSLTVGPCYGNLFTDPTDDQLNAILDCFANGCTAS